MYGIPKINICYYIIYLHFLLYVCWPSQNKYDSMNMSVIFVLAFNLIVQLENKNIKHWDQDKIAFDHSLVMELEREKVCDLWICHFLKLELPYLGSWSIPWAQKGSEMSCQQQIPQHHQLTISTLLMNSYFQNRIGFYRPPPPPQPSIFLRCLYSFQKIYKAVVCTLWQPLMSAVGGQQSVRTSRSDR